MKASSIILVLSGCVLCFPARAEEQPVDIEARKRTIPVLETRIKEREERLGELAGDIMTLNQRLDSRINKIVDKIASIKDSEESGYRISQIKKQAMEGLGRSIKRLQERRADLILEARKNSTATPTEVIEGDAAKFDENVEKRVQQILEISKSYTQSADVEKYQRVAGGGYNYGSGWDDDLYEISDEWRQNRRDRTMDKVQSDEVIAALKKSIERHENSASDLKANLKSNRYSETDRQLMTMELKRHEKLLEARKEALREMSEVAMPNTASVDRNEAHHLQQSLADTSEDLRRDFDTIFAKYNEYTEEREKVYALKDNLAARKKWLEEHAK